MSYGVRQLPFRTRRALGAFPALGSTPYDDGVLLYGHMWFPDTAPPDGLSAADLDTWQHLNPLVAGYAPSVWEALRQSATIPDQHSDAGQAALQEIWEPFYAGTAETTAPIVPYNPPPAPEHYLVNGVTYTNYDDALAAQQAGPPAPPASTTGVIHYDPATDSYLPGPTPSGTPIAPPTTTSVTPTNAPPSDTGGAIPNDMPVLTIGDGASSTTKKGLLIAAGIGAALFFLGGK